MKIQKWHSIFLAFFARTCSSNTVGRKTTFLGFFARTCSSNTVGRKTTLALIVAVNTAIAPGLLINQKIRPARAQTVFEDIQNNWAKDCIVQLIEKEIISGYFEDQTFRPNSPMTRAQFAATIARAFPNAELVREEIEFVDVPTDLWAFDAIQKAYQTGFMSGYIARNFNPTLEISRAEVLMSLVEGLKYQAKELNADNLGGIFDDAAQIPNGAEEAIAAATERGIVVNYPDVKKLAPTRKATRAEVAGFLCQALANPAGTNQVIISSIPSEYIAKVGGLTSPIASETSPTSTPSPTPNYNAVESVRVGNLLAELAYEKNSDSEEGKNFRLKVVSDGETFVEEMLFQGEPVPTGILSNLQLQDLDGDKELEVLIDLAVTNSSMPKGSYSFIFDPAFGGTETSYQKVQHYWGDFDYELTDLDDNKTPEFQGVDGRFANAFAGYKGDEFLPLRIWQYRQGKMMEVTKDFPIEVNTRASEIWQELNRLIAANEEIKGILASYIANKYIIGSEETVWRLVEKLYQGSDREAYFASVRQFLLATGYSKNDGTNPLQSPQIPTATSGENPPLNNSNGSETNPLENIQEELQKRINSPTSPINNSATDPVENSSEEETSGVETNEEEKSEVSSNSETRETTTIVLDEPLEENGQDVGSTEEEETTVAETALENGEDAGSTEEEQTTVAGTALENGEDAGSTEEEETTVAETDRGNRQDADSTGEEETTVAGTDRENGQDAGSTIAPRLVRSLSDGENNSVLSLAIDTDGEILASSSGKEIKLWEVETGELLRTLSGHGGEVRTLAISPDGEAVASGSGDGTIRFWDVETGELLDTIADAGWVTGVGFSDRGNKLLSSALERSLQVWDVWRGRSLYSLNGIGPIAFARNGNLAATGGGRSAIRFWNVPAGQLLKNIAIPTSKEGARAIALTEDGETLVYGLSEINRVFVWNLEAGQIRHTLNGHEGEVEAIVISPDGKLIASSSVDGTIILWELATGRKLKAMEGKGAIVFSPDSETLIGVGGDNQIQVWEIYAP